jgi:hypothetical protein
VAFLHLERLSMIYALLRRSSAVLVALAALSACGSEEPGGDPQDPTGLDDSGIESDSSSDGDESRREVSFRFAPGSTLADAQVRILNLDDTDPVIIAPTDSEGGAQFAFTGSDGDVIRMQIATDTRRYEPADYVLGSTGGKSTLVRIDRPTCLGFEPGLEIDFDASLVQLSVYNDCSDALTLAEPRLRVGTLGTDFELVTLMPVEIGGGLSAGIEIRMTETAARPSEDVLFLDADVGSEQLRYAIGLYALP